MNIVIGLGEIGQPLFNILSKHHVMYSRDLVCTTKLLDQNYSIHIAYPYASEDAFISSTLRYIDEYNPKICVLHSTIPPGTTDKLDSITDCALVYSPVKGRHGSMEKDMLYYTKYIAGNNCRAVEVIGEFFHTAGFKVEVLQPNAGLELAKLLETTYSGILIAWAQEMERFCDVVNSDYYDIGRFFSDISYLPDVLFQPGFIGGHCIVQNLDLLDKVKDSYFTNVIRQSNLKKFEDDGASEERLYPISYS